MIILDHVSKSFGDKCILDDVSLEISSGDRIAIIGESGTGKSTLLRLLLGLIEVDSGRIIIDDIDITNCSESELHDVRLKMGMLFQSGALFDSMTVAENIAFTLIENYGYHMKNIDDQIQLLLSQVDMEGYEDYMPSSLSGGQRKRVGLARAIAGQPSYLFYDEPTTGLDPVLSKSIEDLIVNVNSQLHATTIVVSHQQSTILRTVDKIYMLYHEKLLDPVYPDRLEDGNPIVRCFIQGEEMPS